MWTSSTLRRRRQQAGPGNIGRSSGPRWNPNIWLGQSGTVDFATTSALELALAVSLL